MADQYEIEFYQQKIAGRYKIEVLSLLLLFIIGGAISLWIDKRRKKKYLELQNQLMKSRTDILSGDFEDQGNAESDFMRMLEPSLELCLQLFRRTETNEKLLSLEKKMGVATSLSKTCSIAYFSYWVAPKKQSYYVHVLLKEHLKVGKVA